MLTGFAPICPALGRAFRAVQALEDCDGPFVCLDFLLIQPDLHIGRSGHRLLLIAVKNGARMRRSLDADQCFPGFRSLEYCPSQKKEKRAPPQGGDNLLLGSGRTSSAIRFHSLP